MMTRISRRKLPTVTALIATAAGAIALWLAPQAGAAVNLGYDFPTPGTTSTAGAARAGASVTGTLHNGATVSSGTAVNSSQVRSTIREGYLDIPRVISSVSDPSRGMYMSDSDGNVLTNDNSWEDYTGVQSFGTGTVEVVFKPNFSGAQGSGVTHTFFSHRVGDVRTTVAFRQDGGVIEGRFGDTGASGLVSTPFTNWESDSWYYMALSWSVGSATQMYIREVLDATDGVDPAGAGTLVTGTVVTDPTSQLVRFANSDSAIGIGVSMSNVGGLPATANLDGQMAYFRWTDTYTNTANNFNALFITVVPEPSTGAVVLALCVFAARRIRRQARVNR
jgi:hypothetical protein